MNLRPKVTGRRCLVCGDCAKVQREAPLEQGKCFLIFCNRNSLCKKFSYFLSCCVVDVGVVESMPEVVQECGHSVDGDQGLLSSVCFFVLFK